MAELFLLIAQARLTLMVAGGRLGSDKVNLKVVKRVGVHKHARNVSSQTNTPFT